MLAVVRLYCSAAIVVALFMPAHIHAQPIPACAVGGELGRVSGSVVDPSSAATTNATVIVECAGTQKTAVTDENGNYSVEVPAGSYIVRVEKDGFTADTAAITVTSGQDTVHEFRLKLAASAEAVTVTAGGFEQLVREAPASVTVLSREELQTKRFSSLALALVDVEGVDAGQNVGKTGGLTISIRGMPSDYTLMLIDGRRQNPGGNVTPNGFNETATSFMPPLGAIERIEVVRGPMSTLYGSDAMGGVVNVITRKVSEAWSGTVTVDGTLQGNRSFGDTAQGNFYLTGPLWSKRLGLALRGSGFHRQAANLKYEDSAGQEIPITAFGLSPTRSDIVNLGGRLSFVIDDNNDLFFDGDTMSQYYNNSDGELGTVGLQGGYAEQMVFQRQQFYLAHQGRYRFGLLDSSLTRNVTGTSGRTIPPGTPGEIPGSPRLLDATNTLLDSKLISIVQKHTLSAGGQWWAADMVDTVAPAPFSHKQGALFVEDEWRLLRNFAITGGARFDHHNTFGSKVSPRAYAVYSPTGMFTIKGGVSRGFKTPQLNQLATGIVGFGGQGTIPLIGSPGLMPETSTSTEIGGYLVHRGISLNVTLFNNEFQNKIAAGPGLENCSFRLSPDRPGCVDFGNWPNVDLFGQSINVDNAITRGGEAALRFRFMRRWDVGQNYTFTESEQRSGAQAGQPLVNTPKHMYNANVRFTVTPRFNLWTRVEARTSRTRGTGATAIAATQQIGPFQGYGMAHFGGSYQFSKQFLLNATIYNLFDTNFLTYLPYVYNNVTNYASVYNNLQEPRRFWVSLTYSF